MQTGITAREYSIIHTVDADGRAIDRIIPKGTKITYGPCENIRGAWKMHAPGYGSKITFESPA